MALIKNKLLIELDELRDLIRQEVFERTGKTSNKHLEKTLSMTQI